MRSVYLLFKIKFSFKLWKHVKRFKLSATDIDRVAFQLEILPYSLTKQKISEQ